MHLFRVKQVQNVILGVTHSMLGLVLKMAMAPVQGGALMLLILTHLLPSL